MPTATKRTLLKTHEDFRPTLWAQYLALYDGGSALRESPHLDKLVPRNPAEHSKHYAARVERLLYVNYAAYILNQHVVTLFEDPLSVVRDPPTRSEAFYDAWLVDASAPGGDATSWASTLQQQLLGALVCRLAWTRVSLPTPTVDGATATRTQQEQAGDIHAFATPCPAQMVTRWHATPDGRVEWLVVHSVDDGAEQFVRNGEDVLQWELWTADTVSTWRVDARIFEKSDETATFSGTDRPNPYGRIPFVRLEVPRALWAMDQMSSLVIELLNKHSALSWAEYRALFPQLVAYLQKEQVDVDGSPKGGSADQAQQVFSRPRGPGYGWAFYVGEKLEYVGPPTDSFEYCLKAIESRKVELARVLYALNLAADLSSGSQRRTSESKSLDIAASKPFLAYLGGKAREHTRQVLGLVAHLRGEEVGFTVSGLEHVQPLDISALVEQAVSVSALEIPSRTFQREHAGRVARAVLGRDADGEIVAAIDQELDEAFAHDVEMPNDATDGEE